MGLYGILNSFSPHDAAIATALASFPSRATHTCVTRTLKPLHIKALVRLHAAVHACNQSIAAAWENTAVHTSRNAKSRDQMKVNTGAERLRRRSSYWCYRIHTVSKHIWAPPHPHRSYSAACKQTNLPWLHLWCFLLTLWSDVRQIRALDKMTVERVSAERSECLQRMEQWSQQERLEAERRKVKQHGCLLHADQCSQLSESFKHFCSCPSFLHRHSRTLAAEEHLLPHQTSQS